MLYFRKHLAISPLMCKAFQGFVMPHFEGSLLTYIIGDVSFESILLGTERGAR